MKIPSVVLMWILAILTILISVLGLVMQFFQSSVPVTVASIIGLVIGCLTIVLNWLTNNVVTKMAAFLTLEEKMKLGIVKIPMKIK